MSLYRRWIHRKEHILTRRDTNRKVFPFDWGLDWVDEEPEGRQPLEVIKSHSRRWLAQSDSFFEAPRLQQWQMEGNLLHFPSPLVGVDPSNHRAVFRLFAAPDSDSAIVVVPQWNADKHSHVTLCRLLQRLGYTTLRMSLPYHEKRNVPGMARADYMVSPNIGRTLSATRQAVLEVRQAVEWLRKEGHRRVGVIGTSIGSCIAYLAFAHDPSIRVAVFNHVSAHFADVVWRGLATRYVRWGLEEHVTLDDLRECWAPISPYSYVQKLNGDERKHLLITAKYDLTFLPELSQIVFDRYEQLGIPCDRAGLPCGHYTTAHFPFKYLDGWLICRYFRKHL